MSALPETATLALQRRGGVLHVTLDRPEVKNAMSFAMLEELEATFAAIEGDRAVRVVVLRGAGGDLCAGGDIKDMAAARVAEPEGGLDPLAIANRRFGALLERVEGAPQAVVAIAEGAVMGGGFGVVCAADVAIAVEGVRFRLPETGLGLPPAQIAPFIVRRLGLTEARRLAVTGGELDAATAQRLGLVHETCADEGALQALLADLLARVQRCAPGAVAKTKELVLAVGREPLSDLLDRAAHDFAAAARGDEGLEGLSAFLEKRPPRWATE